MREHRFGLHAGRARYRQRTNKLNCTKSYDEQETVRKMGDQRSVSSRESQGADRQLCEYSDSELTDLARLGSKAAWDTLYLRYKDFLWWLASRCLGLPTELNRGKARAIEGRAVSAEQLMSEVYVRVWDGKRLSSYEGRGKFRSWYTTVVRNILNDVVREERLELPAGTSVPFESECNE